MYNKDPITNPISKEETNYAEQSSEKTRRVNGYMNSNRLISHLEQRLVDTTSDITCNRKKEENEFTKRNLIKQSMAVNDGKKQYLKNNMHIFEGKTGYYL